MTWEQTAFEKLAGLGALVLLPTTGGKYLLQDEGDHLRPPGGHHETTDKNLTRTIIRELGEEFALRARDIKKKIQFLGYEYRKPYKGNAIFIMVNHGLKPGEYQASNSPDEKVVLVEASMTDPRYTGPDPDKLLEESCYDDASKQASAVIVKGNPKWVEGPQKVQADKLYAAIQKLLESQGYSVGYDAGEPHTSPDESAQLWVGHSRGADRLRFAPSTTQTLRVDDYQPAFEGDTPPESHYELTPELSAALAKLVPAKQARYLTYDELHKLGDDAKAKGVRFVRVHMHQPSTKETRTITTAIGGPRHPDETPEQAGIRTTEVFFDVTVGEDAIERMPPADDGDLQVRVLVPATPEKEKKASAEGAITAKLPELRAFLEKLLVRDKIEGHGIWYGACGHIVSQCRCTGHDDKKFRLTYDCDRCKEHWHKYAADEKALPDFRPDFSPSELHEKHVFNRLYYKMKPRLASMEVWPTKWTTSDDPKGWLDWYEQFDKGRCSPHDEKQIKRWQSFKARHGAQFKKKPTARRAWALTNWGIDPLKLLPDAKRRDMQVEMEKHRASIDACFKKASVDEDDEVLEDIMRGLMDEEGFVHVASTVQPYEPDPAPKGDPITQENRLMDHDKAPGGGGLFSVAECMARVRQSYTEATGDPDPTDDQLREWSSQMTQATQDAQGTDYTGKAGSAKVAESLPEPENRINWGKRLHRLRIRKGLDPMTGEPMADTGLAMSRAREQDEQDVLDKQARFHKPENYDKIEEFSTKDFFCMAGENDWENTWTAVWFTFNPGTDRVTRIYAELNPPKKLSDAEYIPKDKAERDWGKVVVRKWFNAANEHRAQRAKSLGVEHTSWQLEDFQETIGQLGDAVGSHGVEKIEWKEVDGKQASEDRDLRRSTGSEGSSDSRGNSDNALPRVGEGAGSDHPGSAGSGLSKEAGALNATGITPIATEAPVPTLAPVVPGTVRTQGDSASVGGSGSAAAGIPRTGPEGIHFALQNLDVGRLEADAQTTVKRRLKSKRPDAVKILGYLDGMKKMGIQPHELMLSKVPVIPPAFRPYSVAGDTFVPGDANELYRDLINLLGVHKELEGKLGAGSSFNKLNIYDAMSALYGFGDPTSPKTKERGVSGFLKKVTGHNPKFSFVQHKMLAKDQDYVARGVIGVDPELGLDEIGVPEEVLWKMYAPYLQRHLVRSGMSAEQSLVSIRDRTDAAVRALDNELKERPVVYSRAPSWHKFNVIGGYAKKTKGDMIRINPLVTTGLNADFDGDTLNIHLPSMPDSVKDTKEKLMPSKMLFSIKDRTKVVPVPKQEMLLGLFQAQHRPARNTHTFPTREAALAAIKRGEVAMSDEVNIANQV